MRRTSYYAAPKRTWYISTINLFEGLTLSEIDEWMSQCGPRTFEAGQRLIDAHTTPPEQVLVVCEGAVRVFLERARPRFETVDLLGRGHLLGVSAAFGMARAFRPASAAARWHIWWTVRVRQWRACSRVWK